MHPSNPTRVVFGPALLLALFVAHDHAAAATAAWSGGNAEAREVPPPAILEIASAATDALRFDESSDGAIWARGLSYKACFAGDATTFIPFFGSDAPRNYPIVFRADGSTLGGELLATGPAAEVRRDDRIVRIDRAAFVEEYVVEEERIEQRFVFDSLPRRGELVLRIEVETELRAANAGSVLRFSNELGHVDYGEAFAFDASGGRIAIERRFDDGAITLVVPDAFVADAELPLTIDPLVSVFPVAQGTLQKISPDVSYDGISARWCVVYEDVFSAADHDVTAKLLGSTGTVLSILTIDATSDYWTNPKVAHNRNVNSFLVVAGVDPAPVASNKGSIRGRRVNAVGATVGPVIQISPWDTTDRDMPDVGGDAFNGASAHFCVVWSRFVNPSTVHVEMQMLTQHGALQGGVVTLHGSTGRNTRPSISNSNGLANVDGALTERWTVAWEFESSSTNRDIHARQVAWNGALLTPAFVIDNSANDERAPSVASLLDPITGQRFGLVVYQRHNGSDEDIMGRLLSGSTVLATRNLSADHPSSASYRQLTPKVDSDGRHFLVGFVELWPPFPVPDVWVSDYFVSGGSLVPWRVHDIFAGSLDSESDLDLCSQYSSGGSRRRYLGAWSVSSSSTEAIQGGLWDGGVGGVAATVCTGDGNGTACPCGNIGASGRGCANSETAGALLAGVNTASVSEDTFVLQGSGMPAFSTCLYFQGTTPSAAGAGIVFGDGKLCAAGTTIRLSIQTNSGGSSQFPTGISQQISTVGLVPAQGATRFYQVWYRDAAAFCTSSTVNLTNGLLVIWAP